jgi:integrase
MAEVWDTSLCPNQHQLHRNTTIIWNEIVALLPNLGLRPVTVPPSRRVYTRVKPEELPATLGKDIDDYLAWCGVDDEFAENARERALAPGTMTLIRGYINAAATALAKSGTDLSSIATLADLVSVESVRQIFRFRHEAVGGHDSSYNVGLGIALAQIAQDWVHTDPDSLAELKRMASKFPRATLGRMSDKNKKRLRQFDDDPEVLKRLLDAPARLWREAMNDPKPTFLTLAKAEAAIAIAFLTEMPVRLENLTALAFDVHLFMASAPGGTSTLDVPDDEVKNGMPIAFDIPPHVAKMLIEFRDVLAPKLLGHRPSHVFVNRDGTLKIEASVRALIQKTVKRHVGIEFNPHTFRHLAGKVILDRDPGAYEVVRQFLGHKRIQTTINFYTGIDTRRAGLHHHRLLEEALAERSKPVRGKRRTARQDRGG